MVKQLARRSGITGARCIGVSILFLAALLAGQIQSSEPREHQSLDGHQPSVALSGYHDYSSFDDENRANGESTTRDEGVKGYHDYSGFADDAFPSSAFRNGAQTAFAVILSLIAVPLLGPIGGMLVLLVRLPYERVQRRRRTK